MRPSSRAGGLGAIRIGGERAGNQRIVVVEPCGDAMHGADEGALAAAHHAEPDAPGEFLAASFDRHCISSRSPGYPIPSALLLAFTSVRAGGEIVEGVLGDADDMGGDEGRAFRRALLGMLQRALPFQHRPAVVVVFGELGEDGGEVDLSVAERAEAAGALHPALEA